jgi:hypothetical protein
VSCGQNCPTAAPRRRICASFGFSPIFNAEDACTAGEALLQHDPTQSVVHVLPILTAAGRELLPGMGRGGDRFGCGHRLDFLIPVSCRFVTSPYERTTHDIAPPNLASCVFHYFIVW